ncbi:Protein kinase superfamily protein [Striga hermonthica]|uniref:Protein kinase superfamily protein n=1 Tax=Striga hermonthica TaxID=68872 RepID=A0A9N7MSC9_STRHE|nr:Protein kinase superfamily protein [Striga hermonthica]
MLRHEYPLLLKTIVSCFITLQTCTGQNTINPDHNCPPSSCGNISNISYPFRLKNDPPHCGDPHYELDCQDNTTVLVYLESHKYLVQEINYLNHTIRLIHPSISQNHDICSFPNYFSNYVATLGVIRFGNYVAYSSPFVVPTEGGFNLLPTRKMNFISCPQPVNSSQLVDVGAECGQTSYLNGSDITNKHMYVGGKCDLCYIDGQTARCSGGQPSCDFGTITRFRCGGTSPKFRYAFYVYTLKFQNGIKYGFLSYLALRTIIGMLCLLWLIIHKLRRQHLSTFEIIEGFLQSNNNLMPIRYSYRDIKRMTSGFRHKLGQGGYGSVYKGKLRSGQIVAVKVLLTKNSRDDGQDFINEIAAIGRIHHVNVVKLVGFYAGRMSNKRALVFDFMPNGSLERYIFTRSEESPKPLSWEKKYEIAVGVAKGIDYLHRGCDIQILHFDIKPHNILLDEDFTPKISDFGLARLYATEKNTVTLTAARGTIGYVAPELINRSIGGVSYKADVYSFGMLLMEMVGLNRDILGNDEESSQYFPYWIYDRFDKGKDIETGEAYVEIDDDDHAKRIERKMAVVGLWCIRMSPADRPTMSEVVKMLETPNTGTLQIPPPPSLQPARIVNYSTDGTSGTEPTGSMALWGGVSSSEISNDGH